MGDYSPGDLEVRRAAIDVWTSDPSTEKLSYAKQLALIKARNPTWALSEKRLKAILKEANLQTNQPLFTYVKETRSSISPHVMLASGLKLLNTKNRGVGLYATREFAKGDKLWQEPPMVQAAPVELLRMMRSGRCCAYCAKSLRTTTEHNLAPGEGIACAQCTGNWCSNACKRSDLLHADTFHTLQRTTRPRMLVNVWKEYEIFCMSHDWKAGYLYALTLLHRLRSPPSFAANINAMAKVRQEVRQKAVTSSSGITLELDTLESMWRQGYSLLSRALKPLYNLTYDEYMEGIGMVNINNLDGGLFLVQSHMNHNCAPNTTVEFMSQTADGIQVRAATNIKAGQELTTTYVDPSLGVEERQYKLRVNWGFICGCARCKDEKSSLEAAKNTANTTNPEANAKPEGAPSVLKEVVPDREDSSATQGCENKDDTDDDEYALGLDGRAEGERGRRPRSKSVHFDSNPVTAVCS